MRVLQGIVRGSWRISFTPQIAKGYEKELLVCVVLQARQPQTLLAHVLDIQTIRIEGLTHAAIVSNVFAQCQFAVNLKVNAYCTQEITLRLVSCSKVVEKLIWHCCHYKLLQVVIYYEY